MSRTKDEIPVNKLISIGSVDAKTWAMVDALVEIHDVLKSFSRDEQQSILAAANALIGNK